MAKMYTLRGNRLQSKSLVNPVLLTLHIHFSDGNIKVERRIEEKVLTMTFKAHNGVAPSYLAELLRDYRPVRALRSSDFPTLAVPTFKLKTVGDRSFCSSGPRAWNSLPPSLRAGALACTDATPGTVSNLFAAISWPLTLMASHLILLRLLVLMLRSR